MSSKQEYGASSFRDKVSKRHVPIIPVTSGESTRLSRKGRGHPSQLQSWKTSFRFSLQLGAFVDFFFFFSFCPRMPGEVSFQMQANVQRLSFHCMDIFPATPAGLSTFLCNFETFSVSGLVLLATGWVKKKEI